MPSPDMKPSASAPRGRAWIHATSMTKTVSVNSQRRLTLYPLDSLGRFVPAVHELDTSECAESNQSIDQAEIAA
jgi:hypothetical protein